MAATTTTTFPHQEQLSAALSPDAPFLVMVNTAKLVHATRIKLLAEQQDEFPALPTADFTKFQSWLCHNKEDGAKTTLKFGTTPNSTINGATTTCEVKPNDLVLSVPLSKCIVARVNEARDPNTLLGKWCAKSPRHLAISPVLQLTMLLLHERRLGKKSSFMPYLSILPREFPDLPFTNWSVEDMLALRGRNATMALRKFLSVMAFYLHATVSGLPVGSLREYLWCVAVISTRQNPCKFRVGQQLIDAPALVPGFDMINHSNHDGPTISSHQDLTTLAFETRATRTFTRGSEFTMFYGARSDAEFLIFQGFMASTSPEDLNLNTTVEILVDIAEKQHELNKLRAALLRNNHGIMVMDDDVGGGGSFKACVLVGGALGLSPLLLCARAATLDNKQEGASLLKEALSATPQQATIEPKHIQWCVEKLSHAVVPEPPTTVESPPPLAQQLHKIEGWIIQHWLNALTTQHGTKNSS